MGVIARRHEQQIGRNRVRAIAMSSTDGVQRGMKVNDTGAPIKVPVGKKITFIAKNEGAAVHDMKILSKATEGKDFMSDALVNPETESKFTATFNKKGTVKFQCDYHLPDMVGTIEVQ